DVRGARHVLLHFIELHGIDVGQGVLLTFHDTLLKTVVDFGEGHCGGVSTIGTVCSQRGGSLQNTHLDVLEVVRLGDRTNVVRHVAETSTPVIDALEVALFQKLQQLFPDFTIQHRLHGLVVRHQEGQVQQVHLRLEVGQVAGGRNGDMHQAHLRLFNDLDVATELGSRANVDLDAAIRVALDFFLELHCCTSVGGRLNQHVSESEVEIGSLCRSTERHGGKRAHRKGFPFEADHFLPSKVL